MSTKQRGISFPFRIGNTGGVVMSETTENTLQHTVEALQQLLLTRKLERAMESDVYSDLDASVFKQGDTSLESLIQYEIQVAAKKIENIEVLSVKCAYGDGVILALVSLKLLTYDTVHSVTLKVGDA